MLQLRALLSYSRVKAMSNHYISTKYDQFGVLASLGHILVIPECIHMKCSKHQHFHMPVELRMHAVARRARAVRPLAS